jgi:hypothetical protein
MCWHDASTFSTLSTIVGGSAFKKTFSLSITFGGGASKL